MPELTTPEATPAAPPAPAAALPAVSSVAAATHLPSVHVRAVITWIAIFPLVALGMTLMGLFTESWHPVLRSFVLTLIVVPIAVYLVVPGLLRAYGRIRARRARASAAL